MDTSTCSPATLEELADRVVAEVLEIVALQDVEAAAEVVEATLEVLTDRLLLFGPWRFDESCHGCDGRIGDHTLDGSCPP